MKKDFYDSHFPSNTTQSAGENLYPVVPEGWSRLTTAYTQNEVNYYMAAAIFASIATVSVGRWSNRIIQCERSCHCPPVKSSCLDEVAYRPSMAEYVCV